MERKILLAKRSFGLPGFYEDRESNYHADKARLAFDSIGLITDIYNKQIAGGKWDGIMSWHPRDLPVFKMPLVNDRATAAQTDSLRKIYFRTPEPKFIIAADEYIGKRESVTTGVMRVDGLGINGGGMARYPKSGKLDEDTGAVYMDYKFSLPPGQYMVIVKCLPDFDINTAKNLRYAIAVNNETPQIGNVHAEADSRDWKENVVRGYSCGKTSHAIKKDTENTLRLWLKDPNMVISTIEFYK